MDTTTRTCLSTRVLWLCAAGSITLLLSCGSSDERPDASTPWYVDPSPLDQPASSSVDDWACTEGQRQPCTVIVGCNNGILSCFKGVRICTGGAWSEECLSEEQLPPDQQLRGATGPVTQTKSYSSCVNNPCDPYCQTYSDEPEEGLTSPGGITGSYEQGIFEALPSGFQNKALKDKNHPPGAPCTRTADCQLDHRCDVPSGICVAWQPGEVDPTCPGIDLTLGPTCTDTLTVCNRGATAAPAGIAVAVFAGNQNQMQDNLGLCNNFNRGDEENVCITSQPIPAGHCINVPGCNLGGTQSIAVNPPASYSQITPVAECNCGNNWTYYHNGSACSTTNVTEYEAATYKQVYDPACAPGTRVQWGYFTYDVETPANLSGTSSMTVEVHSAPTAAELDPDCSDCASLAQVPAQDPQLCSLTGPAPCPKDVYAALGGLPKASEQAVEIVFTLVPTPDTHQAPTLRSWELTWSCPPAE